MGKKLVDIEKQVKAAGPAFDRYLHLLIHEDVMQILLDISLKTDVYLFSGIIRNYFLNIYRKRDIDIVLGEKIDVEKEFQGFPIRKNSFGGYKVLFPSGPLDLWYLSETWAFRHDQRTLSFFLETKIPETAFFNFSSIIYSFNNKTFYYSKHFIKFLKDRKLDYVYEKNPNYALCIVNTLYYSDKYNLGITNRLGRLVNDLYRRSNYDYDEVQTKHFGEVLYSKEEIKRRMSIVVEPRMIKRKEKFSQL